MAENIAKNLWRLDIPLTGNPLKNLNSYLITGEADGRSLLIDTGFRREDCREAMLRQLEEIGVDRDRMDIFLTHLHSDHAGLAPELIRPGCSVFISEKDGKRLANNAQTDHWKNLFADYVREGFTPEEMEGMWNTNPAKAYSPIPWDGYTYLQAGDTLTYGGHTLRCVATPGHTPGQFCLYEETEQWLFSGDHILFHITPNICRWGGVADSLGDYMENLEQLKALPVKLLLPAHREETGDLKLRAEELIAHHIRRIENAWQSVANEPGMTAYQVAGRMAWSIRCRNWEEFPLVQKFVAVGEALAHLDYLEARGRLVHREQNGKNVYFAVDGEKIYE